MELAWAANVLKAQVLGTPEGEFRGVCTDTRQGADGSLFFALQGEQADGHAYVKQAFAEGAAAAVVAHPIEGVTGTLLVVPDPLRALGDLATHYRRQFDIPVIAVTGSVGKTSTKEMIAAVLRTRVNVLASEKNYNNEIGVPLALFQLTPEHGVALIEMGMRGLGEIDRLAEIAEPTIAVITKIGYSHVERLGSREKIAEAKSELLARLPKDGVAVLPAYDEFSDYLRRRVPAGCAVVTYGDDRDATPAPYVRIRAIRTLPSGGSEAMAFVGNREEAFFTLKAAGAHQLHNAGAALAVGALLRVPLEEAVAALEAWEGMPRRLFVRQSPDGMTLLDDSYNAAPDSTEAALATLAQAAPVNGVAVLGDMRELGDFAEEAHRYVGRKVIDANVRLLVTVGDLAKEIAAEAERTARETGKRLPEQRHFDDSEQAAAVLGELVTPKDTVLVKGSFAMKMDRIVAALMGEAEPVAHG